LTKKEGRKRTCRGKKNPGRGIRVYPLHGDHAELKQRGPTWLVLQGKGSEKERAVLAEKHCEKKMVTYMLKRRVFWESDRGDFSRRTLRRGYLNEGGNRNLRGT